MELTSRFPSAGVVLFHPADSRKSPVMTDYPTGFLGGQLNKRQRALGSGYKQKNHEPAWQVRGISYEKYLA